MSSSIDVDVFLASDISAARFVVLSVGRGEAVPRIDGKPLVLDRRRACSTSPTTFGRRPTLLGGVRYFDVDTGFTMLCTSPGRGRLSYAGRTMIALRHRAVWPPPGRAGHGGRPQRATGQRTPPAPGVRAFGQLPRPQLSPEA
jgi:hypothetical protein